MDIYADSVLDIKANCASILKHNTGRDLVSV